MFPKWTHASLIDRIFYRSRTEIEIEIEFRSKPYTHSTIMLIEWPSLLNFCQLQQQNLKLKAYDIVLCNFE